MRTLLSTIFGDITYDDQADAYFWHPWLDQDPSDSGGGGPNQYQEQSDDEFLNQ